MSEHESETPSFPGVPVPSPETPEAVAAGFDRQAGRLEHLLTTLNGAFEERLAALATKQLITRMEERP
jgi:hypothetical protein